MARYKDAPLTQAQRAFDLYMRAGNTAGSGRAASYVKVIQRLGPIVRKVAGFEDIPEDFATVSDLTRLRQVYELVLREQKKTDGGMFAGSPLTEGYWGANFCSAAVRDFINFRVASPHATAVKAIFERETDGAAVASAIEAVPLENAAEYIFDDKKYEGLTGKTRRREVTVRVNQREFHQMVFGLYGSRCCISGLPTAQLLEAAHISPWSSDKANRMNPSNGLCLTNIYHRAFDNDLITFDEDYRLVLSKSLKGEVTNEGYQQFFAHFEGRQIHLPRRFLPDQALLAKRRERFK